MRVTWWSLFLLGVSVFAPLEALVLCVDYYNESFPVSSSALLQQQRRSVVQAQKLLQQKRHSVVQAAQPCVPMSLS
jgi:hypothetical protein